MILVGICDDEEIHRRGMRKLCEQYFDEFPYAHDYIEFSSGEEVLLYGGEQIHLLFLDIEMEGVSGLEVMQKLRRNDRVWRIAFVSNHLEQRLDTIDIKTLVFLEKPVQYAGVAKCLNITIQESEKNKTVVFNSLVGKKSLREDEIYYIKAEIHYIDVFTRDEEIMCCDSFKECEQKLVDSAFVRIHRSYLVNMQHIKKLQSEEVLLDDGTKLPVGRRFHASVKETHIKYISGLLRQRDI